MAYSKQGFISGQTLKAAHINHIEQGLEDIDKNKADKTDLFNKDYNSLNNKPTIPTKTSELANDSGFVSEAFVNQKVADLVNSAPETLDTLGEVAQALQENENVVDTLNKAIGNKVDKVEGKGLSTNDYTEGEKEKLTNAYSHITDTNNPHRVTAQQIGAVKTQSANDMLHNGNEFTFVPSGYSGQVYINHKTAGGVDGNISNYYFGDGKGGLGTFIANYFKGKFQGDTPRLIYNNEEAAMLSDVNALKPIITVDTTSGAKSLTLTTGNSNTEWRYTSASGITSLTLNDSGTFEASTEAYYTILFISGSTATTITNTMEAHFTGDECEDGVFTPVANKTYEVGIWWNGLMWQAVAKGV